VSSVKKLGIYSVFAVTIQVSKGRTLALSRPDALEIRRDILAAVKRTKRKQTNAGEATRRTLVPLSIDAG
jgi:hypothetical protein